MTSCVSVLHDQTWPQVNCFVPSPSLIFIMNCVKCLLEHNITRSYSVHQRFKYSYRNHLLAEWEESAMFRSWKYQSIRNKYSIFIHMKNKNKMKCQHKRTATAFKIRLVSQTLRLQIHCDFVDVCIVSSTLSYIRIWIYL